MNDTEKSIAVILIIVVSLLSFSLGLMVGQSENPCDKNHKHQTIFVDPSGQFYRVNYKLPDTTRLVKLPDAIEYIKVIH